MLMLHLKSIMVLFKNDLNNERISSHQLYVAIQKIDSKTKEVLNNWSSIAKAALSEEFSSAK